MSDDQKIKLSIETEANTEGLKQASDGIKKVGESAKKADKKLDDLGKVKGLESIKEGASEADEGLNDLLERIRKTGDRAGELAERAGELQEKFEDTGDAADGMADDLAKIKRVQLAQALGNLAGDLAKVGGSMKKAGGDMRKFDEDAGKVLETIGAGAEEIGGFVEAGAKGFAAGGPLGAALGVTLEAFEGIAKSIEDAAVVSQKVSSQIDTDWRLSKESLDKVKESVDAYAAAIRGVNGAHDEELRKLNAKLSLQRNLREIQLELAGRETDAAILRINNSDLGESEKRERIAQLRLEHLRQRQEAERKAVEEDIQAKEARLKALNDKEAEAIKRLENATQEAAQYDPQKLTNKERVQEGLLKRLAEETRGVSGSLLSGGPLGDTGVGPFGDLAGSRGVFEEVVKQLEAGGYSKIQPGDVGNEGALLNLRSLATDGKAAVAEDRDRTGGAATSDLDRFDNRFDTMLKLIELIEKGNKNLQDTATAAKAASEKLAIAGSEAKKATEARDAQDDVLEAGITAGKAKRDALPGVQEKEFGAREEQLEKRVQEAEQETEKARDSASAAGESATKVAGDIKGVREATEAATKTINGEAEKGLASTSGLDGAAEKVAEVSAAVESAGQKTVQGVQRLKGSMEKVAAAQNEVLRKTAQSMDRMRRDIETLKEAVRAI